ncbi:MAG: DUF4864 domain-containing protein [Geminicoccaceae bacterium]|nr:DUF4864 domain-containing protein [Geminicoccaceae bacterium]
MRMILGLSLAFGLALTALAAPARADAASQLSGSELTSIRNVIEQQLQAFQVDDGSRAFGFASPDIQQMFQTPDRFMAMVRQGYRPVYRPREVQFLDVVDVGGVPTQRVLLVGPDGNVVTAYYAMERQADGTWKIDGCVLQGAPDLAI